MKLIVLNHKMNLYYNELDEYIEKSNNLKHNLIIAPSNIYLIEFIKRSHHKISSQDICYIEEGNYTGKVSWHQIKSLGVKYSIIGHSEKNESIEKTNIKLRTCLNHGIIPIICFGNETKEENIEGILEKISLETIDNIIFAYEPIFNISKENIDIEYISQQIDIIYNYFLKKYHQKPTIIYGGGINKYNIKEIYNLNKLDGLLIGSISSNISELEKCLKEVDE